MTYPKLAHVSPQPAILVTAALLALFTTRPYAGGWNDGSRLAAVESLGDRGTFQIDESVYVQPNLAERPPFKPGDELLAEHGTKDKMFIDGYFYSDKSPVPSVLMAGVYKALRWLGMPSARERPDWFARVMTWLFAGMPYVLAVWCVGHIARHLQVPSPWHIMLMAGLAFGSLALPYAQHVNNHILLLSVAAAACDVLLWPHDRRYRFALLGLLTGLAYTIDLGTGPLLTVAVGGYVLWHRYGVLIFALCAIPPIVLHHALNYAIAGTLVPGNANPEHFQWPGSPFNASNMTGSWQHASIGAAALYALDLLFGKKGFLLFSLPLVQAILGLYWLLRYPRPERPLIAALAFWIVSTWLLFAITSRNLSGLCLSIRWFVPLVAAGFVVLMVLVRDYPRSRRPTVILIAGSTLLTSELVIRGPWWGKVPWLLWPVVGVSLLAAGTQWIRELRPVANRDGERMMIT